MVAQILNGKIVAEQIKQQIRHTVTSQIQNGYIAPGLAVVQIGSDPASTVYVNAKRKACQDVGFHSFAYNLPSETTEAELLSLIDTLNMQQDVHGILVQLPLPPQINSHKIIERIDVNKDVDGFHPYNFGRLAQGNPHLRPCTPYGVMRLLEFYGLSVVGKHAVIVGASNIVGRPMAMELLHAKATVTICHGKTHDLESHVRSADILVVATGNTLAVDANWLHEKQILVDIGMHRRDDGTVHGDVDFQRACQIVSWITPVPGGAGPMTIAMLLQNTLTAAQLPYV